VLSDNAGGARAAVEHLLAHGHRRIAFLGDRLSVFTAAERRRGYREALGGEHVPELERTELDNSAAAEHAARELLALPDPPTALFTGQNLITIGAISALRGLGRQHEVALIGFDDVVLGELLRPGISVIAQDPYELGRHAGERLFARDPEPRSIVLPTRLIARGSGEIPAV
jgi:LacI family transcriptional regulator